MCAAGERENMLKRRLKTIATLIGLLLVSSNLVFFKLISLSQVPQVRYRPVFRKQADQTQLDSCHSAFDFSFLSQIKQTQSGSSFGQHPKCSDDDWVTITRQGMLLYNEEYLRRKNIEIKKCEYQTVKWQTDDFNYETNTLQLVENGTFLDLSEEFFHVKCSANSVWPVSYHGTFARLFKPSPRYDENKRKKTKQPINVLMLGLDSVSAETWALNLPKSTQFLINKMQTNVIKRFNIVGDG